MKSGAPRRRAVAFAEWQGVKINLVDTPRYDHEYTIFGEVTSGMDVVDGILEGDAIRTVELVSSKTKK